MLARMILLYRIAEGIATNIDGDWKLLNLINGDIDSLINLYQPNMIREISQSSPRIDPPEPDTLLAPIGSQEVWAAGVTYYKSRDARMEESKDSGGQDFYAKVYTADRPELFFKANAQRVVGHLGEVRIRKDSQWNVPEPELVLVINSKGQIVGYTIGNDMSSRDIEGENPLYLPQAKVYDGSCAIGPCILMRETDLPGETHILMSIVRSGIVVYSGETDLTQLKRKPQDLVSYLFRETSFPNGAMLLTGTGIVPGSDFTLKSGDVIHISIEPIGTLTNTVA
jgi:2-dehydro-3-deoxy-D-arabinonate dehydratase